MCNTVLIKRAPVSPMVAKNLVAINKAPETFIAKPIARKIKPPREDTPMPISFKRNEFH